MKRQENCLICGKENTRTYYTGDFGLEEEYYYCSECGYFRQMAYSPMTEGITDVEGKTFEEVKKLYGDKIEKAELEYIPDFMLL